MSNKHQQFSGQHVHSIPIGQKCKAHEETLPDSVIDAQFQDQCARLRRHFK